jgi:hypothetical protein
MIEEVSRDLHLDYPGSNRIWSRVETSAGTSAVQEPRL